MPCHNVFSLVLFFQPRSQLDDPRSPQTRPPKLHRSQIVFSCVHDARNYKTSESGEKRKVGKVVIYKISESATFFALCAERILRSHTKRHTTQEDGKTIIFNLQFCERMKCSCGGPQRQSVRRNKEVNSAFHYLNRLIAAANRQKSNENVVYRKQTCDVSFVPHISFTPCSFCLPIDSLSLVRASDITFYCFDNDSNSILPLMIRLSAHNMSFECQRTISRQTEFVYLSTHRRPQRKGMSQALIFFDLCKAYDTRQDALKRSSVQSCVSRGLERWNLTQMHSY